jgi:nicotinamide mononucleotide transporter
VWGWYRWLHGGEGGAPLRVSRIRGPVLAGITAAGLLVSLGFGLFLERTTDDAVPFWDATTTTFSLAATFMQTRKWLENWIVWIAVDIGLVAKYAWSGLWPTSGLFCAFLCLAVLGLFEWRRSLGSGGTS